eukprot:CAMPEP_0194759584 /NCGR_PEP_ID=MMETSP0323_2-20130528/12619_1 /TAXON_ID=2866 ORGANISM="Crypthecodinium cohnii, Strain Seligo" /NCGR_SAMPLE_ID=MMETSP0323_2 /ASSEMBLY_ACC=CAM_ASM_000346 /LENGTH=81 /DNA_ID=CAMNT_0039680397 /DNA_START=111 /DNA_END=352 /DNA_ORIENTATION=-
MKKKTKKPIRATDNFAWFVSIGKALPGRQARGSRGKYKQGKNIVRHTSIRVKAVGFTLRNRKDTAWQSARGVASTSKERTS